MIRAIVGLGNPGSAYGLTRHNIGFRVLDALVESHGATWRILPKMAIAEIDHNHATIMVIKPLTGMNNSGIIVPTLKKENIIPEALLVVHDELELPFGKITCKQGGSAKGHNGLRSLIAAWGSDNFHRCRFGIGRPAHKEEVPEYVLRKFSEEAKRVNELIATALDVLGAYL